ncbi:MAG: exodeoxyribonuclease V subunit gamma [Spirochaetaceae bacterium]|nr:exodeoxyribonuclease V subunit gamma [Spirochaetaceae bacterium]
MELQKTHLNPQQRKAVETIEGPLLIIAGAGSGKTGVVTSRIANMLNQGIPQASILALTFTNKAAREMEERVKLLTGKKLTNLTVSTFHAFGVQILRKNAKHLGYKSNFTIYDSNDRLSCLKEASRELNLKYEFSELKELSYLFSDIKTGRKTWEVGNDQHQKLYQEYLEHLQLYNAMDFDDLIVMPIELFQKTPEVLHDYQQRYRYVMVDEFQDTSTIQYQLVYLIAKTNGNICCVGDDDQSIYSWRGANYGNIIQFEKDFPDVMEIKLERNYRSTGTILKAANSVIANNTNRKDKELWTEQSENEVTIKFSFPEDDDMEGDSIAEQIREFRINDGVKYGNMGILVRTNSLCKSLEDSLLSNNIPYTVSGGTSFFERKEVKDIIAYLKIMNNPDDDINLLRIINTPRRGIGKAALQSITALADRKGISLYSSISALVFAADSPLKKNVQGNLGDFMELVEEFKDRFKDRNLAATLREFIDEIDYWGYLVQEFAGNDKAAKWRYDNLQMLCDFLEKWEKNPDNLNPSLQKWLNRITLNSRDDNETETGKVNLMTIHASKGLEFDIVFLAGVEDGIIPHARSVEEDPANIEEERRLFYVAITRARKKLFISSCQIRRTMRDTIESSPSPFLKEIPTELVENIESMPKEDEGVMADRVFSSMPWLSKEEN